jgi:high affinity Mn2+ porin
MWQGFGLNDATGAAGFPNGEAFRLGTDLPNVTFARAFFRQHFALGDSVETVADDALQLPGERPVERLTLTVGKLSAKDIFDRNAYANDPRTEFLNWSLMANGAWDYPADALGFMPGAALEWNASTFAVRAGTFLVPRYANGVSLDQSFTRSWSTVVEVEHRHQLGERPGAVRGLAFVTQAQMGNYAATVNNPAFGGSLLATRAWRHKAGGGVNLEQEITPSLGAFLRAGWNDGQNQTWMFTDIDRSASAGLSLKGAAWHRADDTLGLAGVVNEISGEHRRFLALGGTGITVGDGHLNYAPEIIFETYYDARLPWNVRAAVDFQFITNPAYNRDRGPVPVIAGRLHWEY